MPQHMLFFGIHFDILACPSRFSVCCTRGTPISYMTPPRNIIRTMVIFLLVALPPALIERPTLYWTCIHQFPGGPRVKDGGCRKSIGFESSADLLMAEGSDLGGVVQCGNTVLGMRELGLVPREFSLARSADFGVWSNQQLQLHTRNSPPPPR